MNFIGNTQRILFNSEIMQELTINMNCFINYCTNSNLKYFNLMLSIKVLQWIYSVSVSLKALKSLQKCNISCKNTFIQNK